MINFFACACLSAVLFSSTPLAKESLVKLKWRGFARCGENYLGVSLLPFFFLLTHTCVCLGKTLQWSCCCTILKCESKHEEQRLVFKRARIL